MFDWGAARDRLYRISKKQIVQFLTKPVKRDVYGIGFFSDSYDGYVYVVANTEHYYLKSLRDCEARFGPIDTEVFRWDIGNWEYPGGLFPSSSTEQREFDKAWEEYQQALLQIETEEAQGMLEDVCFEVLKRLTHEGVFSTLPSLKGLVILGPDESDNSVLAKKRRLDGLVELANQRAQQ